MEGEHNQPEEEVSGDAECITWGECNLVGEWEEMKDGTKDIDDKIQDIEQMLGDILAAGQGLEPRPGGRRLMEE